MRPPVRSLLLTEAQEGHAVATENFTWIEHVHLGGPCDWLSIPRHAFLTEMKGLHPFRERKQTRMCRPALLCPGWLGQVAQLSALRGRVGLVWARAIGGGAGKEAGTWGRAEAGWMGPSAGCVTPRYLHLFPSQPLLPHPSLRSQPQVPAPLLPQTSFKVDKVAGSCTQHLIIVFTLDQESPLVQTCPK